MASPIELLGRLQSLVRTRLWLRVLIGMAFGVATGLLLSPSGGGFLEEANARLVACWLALPGHIFMALIQMMVVPLVLSSVILGIASGGSAEFLKRVGLRVAPYFIGTTTIAVLIGIMLATVIQPGLLVDGASLELGIESSAASSSTATASSKLLPERIAEIIPSNPTSALLHRSMLQLVVLAMLVGVALVGLRAESRELLIKILQATQELALKVVGWAMALAPIAVFGLLAQVMTRTGGDALVGLGAYVGTVLLGLLMLVMVYALLVRLLGRQNPWRFLANVREVQLLAFSTSSSAAVMPLSMKVAEEKLGASHSVTQFIIPLGATMNMDGTALYQVTAAVFMTQVFGVDLSMGQLALLACTTIGASIGSPSTPGVGIVILASVLQGIGVPAGGIAMILGVDRILDMSRTAVNVTGDLAATVVLERMLGTGATSTASGAVANTQAR